MAGRQVALGASRRLVLAAVALLSAAAVAHAAVVQYNLTVTLGFWSPDCVQKQMYLINGVYPGPTLTATVGDTMVVRVTNGLHLEGLSIHWHGIRQLNTNLMDGASHVTQCPIYPMETMTYRFLVDKAGTFFYHSHLNIQSSGGLYGKLIVYDAPSKPFPYPYDGELAVIINDWYHRTVEEQLIGLDSKPFGWIGNPQSIILNGRGIYDCALVPAGYNPVVGDVKLCNSSSPQCGYEIFEVERGKTYRFRTSSIANLNSLNLAVEGHRLLVVAADAYTVQPFNLTADEGLDLYSGQVVDVILRADQPVANYWVRVAIFGRNPTTPFGLGILRYKGAPEAVPTTAPPPIRTWSSVTPSYNQAIKFKARLMSAGGDTPPVHRPRGTHKLILVGAQQLIDGYIKWAMNNVSLVKPPTPYRLGLSVQPTRTLQAAIAQQYSPGATRIPFTPWNYSAPPPTEARYASNYYQYPINATVDIVLQNINALAAGVSEYHPWHLHGFNFWILGYGWGTFNWATDASSFNLVDPPFRHTVTVLPYGWVALRVRMDNPGAWIFHCHINAHLHMGMAVIIVAGGNFTLPTNVRKCGLLF